MAHDLLTRESPEIIRFFQDIGHITELLKSKPDRYRPVLNGDRYITEAELSESLKITRRTLVEHRTTGLIPYYRLGGRILYKEKDIIKLLDENRMEAFKADNIEENVFGNFPKDISLHILCRHSSIK